VVDHRDERSETPGRIGRFGAGGKGVVFLAEDPELDRRVVVALERRVVRRRLAPDPADRWPSMAELRRATRPRRWRSHLLAVAALMFGVPAAGIALGIATRQADPSIDAKPDLEPRDDEAPLRRAVHPR
jgi:hypothetical protein